MTQPQKETTETLAKDVAVEKGKEPAQQDKSAAPNAPGVTPVAKKPLGQKEVIPFEWKLVGESSGVILTLFKAVDRAEVEAQHDRVRKDGYYKNLRILDAGATIKQRKAVSMGKKAGASAKKPAKTRASRAASKAVASVVSIKRVTRTPPKDKTPARKTKTSARKAKAPSKKAKAPSKKAKAPAKKTKKKAVSKKAATKRSAPKKAKAVRKKTVKKASKKTARKTTRKKKK